MNAIKKVFEKTVQAVAIAGWSAAMLTGGWYLNEAHDALQPAINAYQRFEQLGKTIPAWGQ